MSPHEAQARIASPRENLRVREMVAIFKEIADGRGGHGDFLRSFAWAVVHADDDNLVILLPAALVFVAKYGLWKYAPSRSIGQADGESEAPRG